MEKVSYTFKITAPEKKYLSWMHRLLLLAGVLCLFLTNWLTYPRLLSTSPLIFLFLFLQFLYKQATTRSLVHIGEKVTIQRGVFKKTIQWGEIQQVILKDDLLTIDLKNNRVIQLLTENDSAVQEAVFNSFCQRYL